MNNIMNCLYNLIDEFDNSDIIKNIEKLKKEIMEDKELYNEILDFNLVKNNNSEQIYNKKISLYNNDKIKQYLCYENKLNYIIFDLNKKLNKLIDKKGCN